MSVLATVTGTNGNDPLGPIVQTPDGSIYGATWLGTNNLGSIYRVSPAGVVESLLSFDGTNNGAGPSGMIMGPDGALYGTARFGGMGFNGAQFSGLGSIFRIDTNGNFSTVLTFNGTNGSSPEHLILGRDGAFYGVTHGGGASVTNYGGFGTVFKLTPGGSLTTLHSFDNTDGAGPFALIQGSDGALYGVAQAGGSTAPGLWDGNGTVYRVTTNGVFTKLGECDSATQFPTAIMEATDGTLYGSSIGATVGSIFRVDSGGVLTVVYSFTSYCLPQCLVQMPGAGIYGTTTEGGTYSRGSICRLDITPGPPLLQLASAQDDQLAQLECECWPQLPGAVMLRSFSPRLDKCWKRIHGHEYDREHFTDNKPYPRRLLPSGSPALISGSDRACHPDAETELHYEGEV